MCRMGEKLGWCVKLLIKEQNGGLEAAVLL